MNRFHLYGYSVQFHLHTRRIGILPPVGGIYLQGVPGLSWLGFAAAAAMALAALSVTIVGADERLFEEVLEPLPDFFFFLLSPLQTQNKIEIIYDQNTLKIINICSPVSS